MMEETRNFLEEQGIPIMEETANEITILKNETNEKIVKEFLKDQCKTTFRFEDDYIVIEFLKFL